MVAVIHVVGGLRWLAEGRGRWMGVNLALALVPLALGVVLFKHRHRRSVMWWLGFAAFVVFLPNAPYVVTDLVHLVPDIRAAPSRKAVVLGLLPLYGVFILAGVECYVGCLRLLRSEVLRSGRRWLAVVIEGVVQVLSIIGVLLGRLTRLNSWDVVNPGRVVAGLATISHHPIGIAITTTVVLGVTYAVEWADHLTSAAARRVMSLIGAG